MAVIGKIRSYSGLLIAVIGIALAAFVLGDFMGYGPSGRQDTDVGVIGSKKISYPEFENRVAQQSEVWRQQTGMQTLGARESFQIRQQVWNQMLREILLSEEFESLGLEISPDELTDLIIGNEPHPAILQSFTNPDDGSFDPGMVINFIQNLNFMDPATQNQWFQLEEYVKQQRLESKYHTLIRFGYFVPKAIAAADYQDRSATADIRLIVKRFSDINDSLVVINDRILRNTYNEHRNNFTQEEARDLEYVVFPVFPSDQDREAALNAVEGFRQELEQSENVEAFVNSVSDRRFDPTFYAPGQLSPVIDSLMFNAQIGTIYGPFIENNSYIVAKLNDIQFRPDSMRASHILIAHQMSQAATPETNLDREQARSKADSILGVVQRSPGRFGELATDLSDDPSAIANQGDLGWFPDGAMVPPFNEAVITTPVNNFVVAESDFGFHVIRVTGKSAPTKKVQVAQVSREIEYSNQTYQRVFGQASEFASLLRQKVDFDDAIDQLNLSKRVIDNLRKMDNTIPGIENPRNIIQWAFSDRVESGSVSQIFDLDGRFVIARVSRIRSEGVPSLNEIRQEITEIAIREQKAEMLAKQIKDAGQATSIDALASNLGAEVTELENIRFTNNNLQGFGSEPAVVGAIFATPAGSISSPVKGNMGVFVVEVIRKDIAVEPDDLTAQQRQMQTTFRNRVESETFRAIQESADIKDNRHRFF
jgi:peptidyl-prolyl cis-trans isomerase D